MSNGMKERCTILFVTWMGGGNVRPVLASASDLVRRGHNVHILSNPAMRESVESVGAHYHPYASIPPHDPGTRETDVIRAYEGQTIGETNDIIARRLVFGPAAAFCRDTLSLIDAVAPRVVVADYVLPGAMVAAEARGIPYIVVSDGMFPLPYPGRPRGATPYAYLFERMTIKWLPHLNDLRRSLGVAEIARPGELYAGAARFLVMTYAALGGFEPPQGVTFAGPQFSPPDVGAEALARRRQSTPIVVCSFSTIVTEEQTGLIRRLARALDQLDVEAWIGTGSSTAAGIDTTYQRVKVSRFIPLEQLLPEARLMVNHAGNGTVVRALAFGVPQLCIPFIQDQHDYAHRIADLGVGLSISKRASVDECAAALGKLLSTFEFLDRAEELRRRIVLEHQESLAARLIEEAALLTLPMSEVASNAAV
jgi:UDP:flavonoid glycosyltransferase YjiC (YdhE family)